jgi:formate hydrogenlyase transcriptional activator
MGKRISHIPNETLDALTSYSWPGNVRELQNLIERAVILSDEGVLPNPVPVSEKKERHPVAIVPAHGTLRDAERSLIFQTLEAAGWRIGGTTGAAVRLGLKRTTLIGKMKRFGIARPLARYDIDVPNRSHETQEWSHQAAD